MGTLPGNCTGLVAATVAVADNVNALREAVLCLTELLRQALPPKGFYVLEENARTANQAALANAIRESILAAAVTIARTDPVESPAFDSLMLEFEDIPSFQDCTSQYYCAPGFVRNAQGVCVPISEYEGGGQ